MSGNLAFLRNGNGVSQQHASAIPRVPYALRYPCAPGNPGRIEGVLEEHGHIKLFATQHANQPFPAPEAFMSGFIFVNKDTVCVSLLSVQVCHPRAREDDDFGLWPATANRSQRGNRHHRIADPICRPNQNLHARFTGCERATAARTVFQNASSSLSANRIRQAYIGNEVASECGKLEISFSVQIRAPAPRAIAALSNSCISASA